MKYHFFWNNVHQSNESGNCSIYLDEDDLVVNLYRCYFQHLMINCGLFYFLWTGLQNLRTQEIIFQSGWRVLRGDMNEYSLPEEALRGFIKIMAAWRLWVDFWAWFAASSVRQLLLLFLYMIVTTFTLSKDQQIRSCIIYLAPNHIITSPVLMAWLLRNSAQILVSGPAVYQRPIFFFFFFA